MYTYAELLAKLKDIQEENAVKHLHCIALLNKINGKLNEIEERMDVFGCELTALRNQSQKTAKALHAIHAVVTTWQFLRHDGEPQEEPPAVKEVQVEPMLSVPTESALQFQ